MSGVRNETPVERLADQAYWPTRSPVTRGTPVVPLHERLEIARSTEQVDEAITDNTLEKTEAWRQVGFHRPFKGEDRKGAARAARGNVSSRRPVWKSYLPYAMHVSSTEPRQSIHVGIADGRR